MSSHAASPADDLVTVCRRDAATRLDHGTLTALLAEGRLEGLLDAAAAHELLGLVVETVARAADAVDEVSEAAERIRAARRALRRRAALLVVERNAVAEALQRAGVAAVALKGAALIGTVYAEPTERDLGDIDFLVTANDVMAAVDALARRGYRPPPGDLDEVYRRHHFHLPLRLDPMPLVEVHWDLSRRDSAFGLDADAVFRDARTGGVPVVPRDEHTLVHLALQNVQEGFSRFSRIVDVDRVVATHPALDWDEIERMARNGGMGPATGLTLRLAEDLLGTPVPAATSRRLAPDASSRFHIALLAPRTSMLERRYRRRFIDEQLLLLWLLPRWTSRFKRLTELVLRDPSVPSGLRRGVGARLSTPAKLVLRQVALYGRLASAPGSPEARQPIRFWSSQASSSERL